MKTKTLKGLQLIEMVLGVAITALGLSLMMKSGLGQTAVVAFTQNLAFLTQMKSGTLIIIFNCSCVLIQILIQRRQFPKLQLLQVLVAWLQGQIVNVFCYDLPGFSTWIPGSYGVQWLAMIAGILLASYGVAVMMTADLIRHPFEQLVMVLSQRWAIPFSVLRSRADMFFIGLSLLLIVIFHLELTTLREGTWVSMLLLGRSMAFTFPAARKCSGYCQLKERVTASVSLD